LQNSRRHAASAEFAEWASDAVYQFLRDIGIQRPGRIDDKIAKAVSQTPLVDEALRLVRLGYSPVVVVTDDSTQVVPDFLIGSALGRDIGKGPLLVVPIRDAFVQAFSYVDPKLPKEPKYAPANVLLERTETKTRTRKYQAKSEWEFELK
jgi:hypothetical protein